MTDDEREIARQAIAEFAATFPIRAEPTIAELSERAWLAVLAYRALLAQRGGA